MVACATERQGACQSTGGELRCGSTYDLEEETTSETESLVDLERSVELRIVDQTLPADGCSGLREAISVSFDERPHG